MAGQAKVKTNMKAMNAKGNLARGLDMIHADLDEGIAALSDQNYEVAPGKMDASGLRASEDVLAAGDLRGKSL